MEISICIGCGLEHEAIEGPTHAYMLSSPACWHLYGQLLAREYQYPGYMHIHALTVDAYALQHPGAENPQAISSVYVHLTSLYAFFVKNIPLQMLPKVKQAATEFSKQLDWITPPEGAYALRVNDVLMAADADTHKQLVIDWAKDTFSIWSGSHARIADLYQQAVRVG